MALDKAAERSVPQALRIEAPATVFPIVFVVLSVLCGAPVGARASGARPIHTGLTVDFPYRDRVLLEPGQSDGGRVWVPDQVLHRRGAFPLIVLLHGVRTRYEYGLHRLLPRYQDLPRLVRWMIRVRGVQPVILAAPSQTQTATFSGTLWTARGFDLADFIEKTQQALLRHAPGVRIDRRSVSVFGHSGAGCGFGKKGLYRIARQVPELERNGIGIRVLGLMDVCFNGKRGGRLLKESLAGTGTRVFAMWVAPERWGSKNYRKIKKFAGALGRGKKSICDRRRYGRCREFGRRFLLFKARRRALVRAFRDRKWTGTYLPPHSTLPLWFMEEAFRLYYFRPFAVTRFLNGLFDDLFGLLDFSRWG